MANTEDGHIEIDGSHGEGGGQIIRTSVSLAAVLGKAVKLTNIRANRPKPGLRAQHMVGINALSKLCKAKVEGLRVGSTEVTFRPSAIEGGRQTVNIGTAGSITLVIQTLLLPSLYAPKEVFLRIHGGTDVRWSPSVDYSHYILLSVLRLMGAEANLGLINRGYYPKGGGEVHIKISPLGPEGLRPLVLLEQKGEPKVFGSVHTSGLPDHVGTRLKKAARKRLTGFKGIRIMDNQWDAPSPGAGITLVAEFKNTLLGSCGVGERGKRAEKVSNEAVDELMADHRSGATVDTHLADQLIPFMALASGPSVFLVRDLTEHTRTNMWVVEQFTDANFTISEDGGLTKVTIEPATVRPGR
jgi:RNA 3'-phosphate cyclase